MVLTSMRTAAAILLFAALARAQRPGNAPRSGDLLYGFALECTDCSPGYYARGRRGGGENAAGEVGVWSYRAYPHVLAVEPGSAAERAGVRPGDELHTIDGLSLLDSAGADRFARAWAGQQVRLGFTRDGKPLTISLHLGLLSVPTTKIEGIYRGYMSIGGRINGDVHLDFWTDEPIYAMPDPTTGTTTFQIGTSSIVRMRATKDSNDAGAARSPARSAPLQVTVSVANDGGYRIVPTDSPTERPLLGRGTMRLRIDSMSRGYDITATDSLRPIHAVADANGSVVASADGLFIHIAWQGNGVAFDVRDRAPPAPRSGRR